LILGFCSAASQLKQFNTKFYPGQQFYLCSFIFYSAGADLVKMGARNPERELMKQKVAFETHVKLQLLLSLSRLLPRSC
jgi:hypothetical protein